MMNHASLSPAPYGYRRRPPVSVPVATLPKRDRGSKLEKFIPVALTPQNWAVLLRDDHPLGRFWGLGGAEPTTVGLIFSNYLLTKWL